MLDKDFADLVFKSAGVGAAIGWVVQLYMWREERSERRELQKFLMNQLITFTVEKTNGTNAISALTAAVNAVMALVRNGTRVS